jgi:hypothetical protein
MDGPIHFGERDRWWDCYSGVLTPGILHKLQSAILPETIRELRFKNFFDQVCFAMRAKDLLPRKNFSSGTRSVRKIQILVPHISKKTARKVFVGFHDHLQQAWGGHGRTKKKKNKQS